MSRMIELVPLFFKTHRRMIRVLFYYVAIVSPLNKFEFTSQGMT